MAIENPVADIIAARIFVRAGQLYETRQQAGLFNLLTSLMTRGTAHRSSLEVAEAVESVGASLGADATSDYSLVSLKTVTADFAEIFQLAAEILRQPSFPEDEIELERRLTLQGLRSMQEQPFTIAYNQLREAMYAEHPYAISSLGTAESVAALDRQALLSAHQTFFRPDSTIVTVVGRIAPQQAVDFVARVLGDWQAPPQPQPSLLLPALTPRAQRLVTAQATNQSIIAVGYLAGSVKHPDYAALKLLSTYLGNGLSSRLFVELREKQGLAYDVSAFYPTRLSTSQFVAYIGTAPHNSAIALEGLQREFSRLCERPLSEADLQVCKNKMLGQYALGKQTNGQIAQLLGWYEVMGLGLEFDQRFQADIAAVTCEDAQAAAQRCFADAHVSILGPAEAVEPLR
ncbi:MAG: insulinase family protein [Leptolyngbya sp. SIO4C1]|nr:insulinase family protein [Leptolyngbya sp. SIO4C1]